MPRIARLPKREIYRAALSPLVLILLANQNRACISKFADNRSIIWRYSFMRVKHPGAQRRRKSQRMHLVFYAEWQAVQRTTVFAGRDFLLRYSRFCHSLVSVDGNPSPELWVVVVDAFKAGAH